MYDDIVKISCAKRSLQSVRARFLWCMGAPTCLTAIFAKGDNFFDFLFASLDDESFANRIKFGPKGALKSLH